VGNVFLLPTKTFKPDIIHKFQLMINTREMVGKQKDVCLPYLAIARKYRSERRVGKAVAKPTTPLNHHRTYIQYEFRSSIAHYANQYVRQIVVLTIQNS
jgi:hypothetical protein